MLRLPKCIQRWSVACQHEAYPQTEPPPGGESGRTGFFREIVVSGSSKNPVLFQTIYSRCILCVACRLYIYILKVRFCSILRQKSYLLARRGLQSSSELGPFFRPKRDRLHLIQSRSAADQQDG